LAGNAYWPQLRQREPSNLGLLEGQVNSWLSMALLRA
jgi:hypothetical protein